MLTQTRPSNVTWVSKKWVHIVALMASSHHRNNFWIVITITTTSPMGQWVNQDTWQQWNKPMWHLYFLRRGWHSSYYQLQSVRVIPVPTPVSSEVVAAHIPGVSCPSAARSANIWQRARSHFNTNTTPYTTPSSIYRKFTILNYNKNLICLTQSRYVTSNGLLSHLLLVLLPWIFIHHDYLQ